MRRTEIPRVIVDAKRQEFVMIVKDCLPGLRATNMNTHRFPKYNMHIITTNISKYLYKLLF